MHPAVAAWFCTDPLRLRQILHNFVSNAIKFTLAGSIELALDVVHTAPDEQLLKFTVRDTGIGISAANQAKLFQAFVQADGDTTRRFGGTGLGLAICLGLADNMGGTISMDSAPGLGTTISLVLSLPVLQEIPGHNSPDQPPPPPATTAPSTESSISRRKSTAALSDALVLVVDDHATNRNVLVRQLASLGYRADSAMNGVDALAKLETRKYSLLISDCQMPEMDGYTLARTIRETAPRWALPRLPIIAFTASACAHDVARALDAGMDDYLAKPTSISSLSALLERYLPLAMLPVSKSQASTPHGVASGTLILDEEHLAAVVGNESSARNEFLQEFKASCDIDAKLLEEAYQAGDLGSLINIAHRICGASKVVGAASLADACRTIELRGRECLAMSEADRQTADAHSMTRAAYAEVQHQLNAFNNFLIQGRACLNNASSQ
ncbi:MAG: response regulator [Sphingomonadaceae bacterium]